MRVSVYKNIKSIAPLKDTSVLKVLDEIKNGHYKKPIASIRIEPDKKIRSELK